MWRIGKFVFGVGILLARVSFAESLPMVAASQLSVGSYWTWTYFTQGDLSQPYSAETYRVIDSKGAIITFEISSRYDDYSVFTPNTRFKVDLSKCYEAFKNPELKVNFMIALYPRVDGKWAKNPIWTEATAFEEKFNCNSIFHTKANSLYETRFEVLQTETGEERLFQQWPKGFQSQLRSFYYYTHDGLEGVAYKKAFNLGTEGYYEMRLTDWGQ